MRARACLFRVRTHARASFSELARARAREMDGLIPGLLSATMGQISQYIGRGAAGSIGHSEEENRVNAGGGANAQRKFRSHGKFDGS